MTAERPWLDEYPPGVPAEVIPRFRTAVELLEAAAAAQPAAPGIHYFDAAISFSELRGQAHALAEALRGLGVGPGDRIAVMLQNQPAFVVVLHASWLLGAIVTPVSPMQKEREVGAQLRDAGASVAVCLESLFPVVEAALAGSAVTHVVTTSELEGTDYRGGPLVGSERLACPGALDLATLVAAHSGAEVDPFPADPDSPAVLTYTSGTTGPPKGALNTHRNICTAAAIYCAWAGLDERDVVLGMAPLFHITGVVAHVATALTAGAPLILFHRFDAAELLRLVELHRATFTIGPLTAFIALVDHPDLAVRDISSLRKVLSGGAPVSPAVVERFERATGILIHNVYGMTETNAPSHMTPLGVRGPVDPDTGALSVGIPSPGIDCRVVDVAGGEELAPGEIGEIVVRGPTVVPGYWGKPEETAHALRGGWLHTGDVGKRDERGWFFVVDRAKDMIVASGYKVWPREVEDVLYEHPAVAEACVVGVPDDYRGETVKAYVRLKPGRGAGTGGAGGVAAGDTVATELIAHCRALLAPYKAPRVVEIVDELPKTASGKLLRRELRERGRPG